MSSFLDINGTLEEALQKVDSQYTNKVGSCHSNVLSGFGDITEKKCAWSHHGFTTDDLTHEIGDIEFSDIDGLYSVLHSLENIFFYNKDISRADMPYDGWSLLKGTKIITMNSTEWYNMDRDTSYHYLRLTHALSIETLADNSMNGVFKPDMKFSKFLSKYVESLIPGITDKYALANSATKTWKLYHTVNPHIMLNASESATFSSCYHINGEYHYGVHSMILHRNVSMIFSLDTEGNIQYRRWVVMNDTQDKVARFQAYSHLNTKIVSKPARDIEIRHLLKVEGFDFKETVNMCIEGNGSAYIDCYYIVGTLDANEGERDDIYLPSAINVTDGYSTDDEALDSGQSYCECCEEYYHEDEMNYTGDNHTVCDSCLSDYYGYCEESREYYHNDRMNYIESCDYYVEDGHLDNYTSCAYDDTLYPTDDMTETYDGHYVADDNLGRIYEVNDTYFMELEALTEYCADNDIDTDGNALEVEEV